MKAILCLILTLTFGLSIALAGGLDGKWIYERTIEQGGKQVVETQTFEFQTSGDKLTGTVMATSVERGSRTVEIKEGKIDGNKFSFRLIHTTPFGEVRIVYQGTVENDILKGLSGREGGNQHPFQAKRK